MSTTAPQSAPRSKAAIVRDLMATGAWEDAIRIAASFGRLDKHRAAILDARSAYTNPRFLSQIGKDPEALKAGGRAALLERFGA